MAGSEARWRPLVRRLAQPVGDVLLEMRRSRAQPNRFPVGRIGPTGAWVLVGGNLAAAYLPYRMWSGWKDNPQPWGTVAHAAEPGASAFVLLCALGLWSFLLLLVWGMEFVIMRGGPMLSYTLSSSQLRQISLRALKRVVLVGVLRCVLAAAAAAVVGLWLSTVSTFPPFPDARKGSWQAIGAGLVGVWVLLATGRLRILALAWYSRGRYVLERDPLMASYTSTTLEPPLHWRERPLFNDRWPAPKDLVDRAEGEYEALFFIAQRGADDARDLSTVLTVAGAALLGVAIASGAFWTYLVSAVLIFAGIAASRVLQQRHLRRASAYAAAAAAERTVL